MELYLIRHAQSQNNALPEIKRVPDPGLTELGRNQAMQLAAAVPKLNLDRVITSPFRRTLETTEEIRRVVKVVPEVRVHIHEQGGCYRGYVPAQEIGEPGMTRSEIDTHFPGLEIESRIDEHGWWKRQPYESFAQARSRAKEILAATRDEFGSTDARIAYVMHADIMMLMLDHVGADLVDVPINTSITKVVVTPTSNELVDFNRVDHLTPDLITC